jgi:hypothetical protein
LLAALRGTSSTRRPPLAESAVRAAEIGAATVAAFAATLSIPRLLAPTHQGIIATVIGVSDAHMHGMYGGFHFRHLIGAFGGFASAICSLPQMYGLSQLFRQPLGSVVRTFGTFALVLVLSLSVSWSLYRARTRLTADGRWVDAIASIAWFATIYVVAFYFLAGYDKIWFFAMCPMGQLVALAFDVCSQDTTLRRALLVVGPGVLLLLANLIFVAVPRRFAHNYDLDAAVRISTLVQPTDMLVTPGWDAPSVYARSALRQPLASFGLTGEAMDTEFQAAEISRELSSQAQRTFDRGGHVYFLGLLDLSPEQWQFYGSELHLPYELLGPYRQASLRRSEIRSSTGPVTLFEFVGNPP